METLVVLQREVNPFSSALDALVALEDRGFTADFGIINHQLFCSQTKSFFSPQQFDVLEIYRFHDENEGEEESIIYAIECYGVAKGILLQRVSHTILNPYHSLQQKLERRWLYQ